eukprot:TRINITY_DN286_c0_g1_i6.p1 TRINITY_DN286_c0_g1~~TRINITY_DN286_c0_g1_i6.p1  ORF type:complete len:295 (-),score=62.89 TRINITY_DN286_c0_g1_i6:191-1075(-)
MEFSYLTPGLYCNETLHVVFGVRRLLLSTMARKVSTLRLIMLLSTVFGVSSVLSKKYKVPDKLDDVVDDEEDGEWKQWGQRKFPEVPKSVRKDGKMDLSVLDEYDSAVFKGPAFAFCKLRYDPERTKEDALRIAMKWSDLIKAGSVHSKFQVFDKNTLLVHIEDDRTVMEVKDFVLEQPEAYEFKLGNSLYRRPEDPPSSEFWDSDAWKDAREHEAKRLEAEDEKKSAERDALLEKLRVQKREKTEKERREMMETRRDMMEKDRREMMEREKRERKEKIKAEIKQKLKMEHGDL